MLYFSYNMKVSSALIVTCMVFLKSKFLLWLAINRSCYHGVDSVESMK